MSRPALRVGVASAIACASVSAARSERLTVSLSTHRVQIESNYTGAELVLFGVIERDGQSVGRPGPFDVVVTVRGPRETVTVRRKEPTGPVWINRSQRKFVAVPAVLGVFASRPLELVADIAIRRRLRIGIDGIVDAPDFAADLGEADDPYRQALVRLKRREGLWSEEGRGVTFVTGDVFRAPLPLRGTAPPGNYDVEVVVLSQGVPVGRTESGFEVAKAGFEEQVTTAARDRALPYGLGIAGLSLMFGWLASVIFRRD